MFMFVTTLVFIFIIAHPDTPDGVFFQVALERVRDSGRLSRMMTVGWTEALIEELQDGSQEMRIR